MIDQSEGSPATQEKTAAPEIPRPRLCILGSNPVRVWGMTSHERIARISRQNGATLVGDWSRANIIANDGFAFDPAWFKQIADNPGTVLTCRNEPVLAHVRDGSQARMLKAGDLPHDMKVFRAEDRISIANDELRKRETPFVLPLREDTASAVEQASYAGAYKGVTDLLTKYLWPKWAFVLTKIAASVGLTPNMVTSIGFLFCVTASLCFWTGQYWAGMATGLISMVLDTVDGKLARCTITSSKLGNAFDHGIDLIHPPIWWWGWAMGLDDYGTPLPDDTIDMGLIVIVGIYVLQRLIEGVFIAGFHMHIHVWRPIDSHFRLITARRNPNMLLLFVFLCFGRPDWGFIALAGWSVASCLFHVVRLVQASMITLGGRRVESWLAS